jgi:hypothetical protein
MSTKLCSVICSVALVFTDLFLVQAANAAPASALTKAPAAGAKLSAQSKSEASGTTEPALSNFIEAAESSLRIYQSGKDAGKDAAKDSEHWQKFFQDFKEVVSHALQSHEDPSPLLKRIKGINDLGIAFADGGSVKIWSFPKVAESEQLLVFWQEAVARAPVSVGRRGGRLRKALPPLIVSRLEAINCPSGTVITSARLLALSSSGATKSEVGRALILLGSARKTGGVFLQGYKLSSGRWIASPELFSGAPPFLIQNLTGSISFSGNNLIIGLGTSQTATNKGADNQSAGGDYKISLVFMGDHYALDQKSGGDPATTVAMQFVTAIQVGRIDLVKGWLADPKLASVPAYLGLYSRDANSTPFKLIPMVVNNQNGIARFRLITFGKNDLILDVGKVKGQLAVKALFIAPPDALAKKIVSTSPAAQVPPAQGTQGQAAQGTQ